MGRPDALSLRKPVLISIVVSCLMLGLTALLAILMAQEVARNQHAGAEAAAASMRADSDQYVSRRELALRASVAFFEGSEQVTEEEFNAFAASVRQGVPALRSINFIDRGLTIRWVVPLLGNEAIRNRSLKGLTGERLAGVAAAMGHMAVSDPIPLVEGGTGFLMILPVREDGRVLGYVEVVNEVSRFIEVVELEAFSRHYDVRLSDSAGHVLYQSAPLGGQVVTVPLPIGDRVWHLAISPRVTWWDQLPTVMVGLVGLMLWAGAMGLLWGDWFSARRLAREVAARTADLAASRDQLAIILDGVADAIVAWTPELRLVYANPGARRFLSLPDGMDAMWAGGVAPFEVSTEAGAPVAPEDLPTMRAARGERVVGELLRYRLASAPEDARVVTVSATPVFDQDGQIRLVIVIYHDLSERIRLEGQLKAQLEELKQLDRLKGEFLSVVTHELRTPLTSIKGYAEFLEDEIGGPLTHAQRDYLAHIQLSASQLEMLVDDLLDLARIEAGKFTLRIAKVDAAAIARQVGEAFRPQAQEADLELVVDVPERAVPLDADSRRLVQVLNNLMSNALKFTRRGGQVRLSLVDAGDQVRMAVTDSGIGVAPEHLPKLFSKFYQVEGALNRTYKGTGLGLPITKGLVEAHGGTIEVESELGRGTTFTVALPRGGASEDAA